MAWSLCCCAFLCTHAFLNTLYTHKPYFNHPLPLTDLEAWLSPPLLWYFKRRERFRITVGKIHLGDIAERGSPSLPARYLPRLAGDEGGSHCSWLHFTVVTVWFLCRCCRYTHLELETKENKPQAPAMAKQRNMHLACTLTPANLHPPPTLASI